MNLKIQNVNFQGYFIGKKSSETTVNKQDILDKMYSLHIAGSVHDDKVVADTNITASIFNNQERDLEFATFLIRNKIQFTWYPIADKKPVEQEFMQLEEDKISYEGKTLNEKSVNFVQYLIKINQPLKWTPSIKSE